MEIEPTEGSADRARPPTDMFNIVTSNIEGLGGRGRALWALITKFKPSVIVLNETKS